MLAKYKRNSNSVEVEAFEFDPENIPESEKSQIFTNEDGTFFTEHPHKRYGISPGMFLVKRASGYLYPMEKVDFESQYSLV
jgi:hypothetical protein